MLVDPHGFEIRNRKRKSVIQVIQVVTQLDPLVGGHLAIERVT